MESKTERNTGVLRGVRLGADGTAVKDVGEPGDLIDAISYATRLAELIGDALGLGAYRGLESAAGKHVLVTYKEGQEIVGLEAEPGPALVTAREKAGT